MQVDEIDEDIKFYMRNWKPREEKERVWEIHHEWFKNAKNREEELKNEIRTLSDKLVSSKYE